MQLRKSFNASVARVRRVAAAERRPAPRDVALAANTNAATGVRASRALMHRAQQWFAARERMVALWFTRTGRRARAGLHSIASRQSVSVERGSIAQSPVAPRWWEYESELKRRLALEILLRRLFALVPVLPPELQRSKVR